MTLIQMSNQMGHHYSDSDKVFTLDNPDALYDEKLQKDPNATIFFT